MNFIFNLNKNRVLRFDFIKKALKLQKYISFQ